jgi:hypothetical protein
MIVKGQVPILTALSALTAGAPGRGRG